MEFTLEYILSQVFVVISYVFLALTYFSKNRSKIIVQNSIALVTMGLSYIFLSAYTGFFMVIFAVIRNIIFYFMKDKDSVKITKNDIIVLIILIAITIIFTVFTYDGFLSLMSVFATLLYTISIWQKNVKLYRLLGIFVSILWIIYNFYIMSIFGIILESVLLTFVFISFIKYTKENSIKLK